jgi:hypothetical protein
MWDFIIDNLAELVIGLMAFIKIIVNITPTEKDNQVFGYIDALINMVFAVVRVWVVEDRLSILVRFGLRIRLISPRVPTDGVCPISVLILLLGLRLLMA